MRNLSKALKFTLLIPFLVLISGCGNIETSIGDIFSDAKSQVLSEVDSVFSSTETQENTQQTVLTSDLPEYDGQNQVIVINNNAPDFSESDLIFEKTDQTLSDLDYLNRVGDANAVIGQESFPTEERERLYIDPTGWNQKKLDNGNWLYNRCHLVGYQLTGENNNPKNLMTGTRSFNTPCMLDYENQIADYIKSTGNHVRYRVTPVFLGDELVARGIQLEAQSIEDGGLSFNVYIYNVQDGYTIDYATGKATKN